MYRGPLLQAKLHEGNCLSISSGSAEDDTNNYNICDAFMVLNPFVQSINHNDSF